MIDVEGGKLILRIDKEEVVLEGTTRGNPFKVHGPCYMIELGKVGVERAAQGARVVKELTSPESIEDSKPSKTLGETIEAPRDNHKITLQETGQSEIKVPKSAKPHTKKIKDSPDKQKPFKPCITGRTIPLEKPHAVTKVYRIKAIQAQTLKDPP